MSFLELNKIFFRLTNRRQQKKMNFLRLVLPGIFKKYNNLLG